MFFTADIPPPPPIVVEVRPFTEHTGTLHWSDYAALVEFNNDGWRRSLPPVVIDNDGVIYEDDPRWDCRTMGNRTCGSADGGYLFYYSETGAFLGGSPTFGISNREVSG